MSIGYRALTSALMLCTALPAAADPATSSVPAIAGATGTSGELIEITVTAERLQLIGTAATAGVNAAAFWYVDRLPGEPATGVADVHIHPLEPISARLTLSKSF